MPDHCSCESKPGEVSFQEEMHFLLFAMVWAMLEASRNVDFGKGKANALALKPKNCASVITSCAVVYESADCTSGWMLPINEVPYFKPTNDSMCSSGRKEVQVLEQQLQVQVLLFFLSCPEHLKLDFKLIPGATLMWLQFEPIANLWVISAATTMEPR